jgi:hypothetical protein
MGQSNGVLFKGGGCISEVLIEVYCSVFAQSMMAITTRSDKQHVQTNNKRCVLRRHRIRTSIARPVHCGGVIQGEGV